jgi:hypothetical protein
MMEFLIKINGTIFLSGILTIFLLFCLKMQQLGGNVFNSILINFNIDRKLFDFKFKKLSFNKSQIAKKISQIVHKNRA